MSIDYLFLLQRASTGSWRWIGGLFTDNDCTAYRSRMVNGPWTSCRISSTYTHVHFSQSVSWWWLGSSSGWIDCFGYTITSFSATYSILSSRCSHWRSSLYLMLTFLIPPLHLLESCTKVLLFLNLRKEQIISFPCTFCSLQLDLILVSLIVSTIYIYTFLYIRIFF